MFHAGRACEQQLAGWSGVEHEVQPPYWIQGAS
jgi:hypothetical protein